MHQDLDRQSAYEAPRTHVIGTLEELTAQTPGRGDISPSFPSPGGGGESPDGPGDS